jgi:hypothetical protein
MRTLVVLSALFAAACDDAPTAAPLPVDQAAPPTLTVVGTCPGTITLELTGLAPGAPWGVAASPNLAPGVVVPGGPCAGMALRVGPPAFLGASGTANALGEGSATVTVPAAGCGYYLQPADLSVCQTGLFVQL